MGEDELAQQGVMSLAGMVILTVIPVVAFALWCDYFERFFKARVAEREPVELTEEVYRVRAAGLFISLFQVLIFFGTTPIRHEHPFVAYPVFALAFLMQISIQRGTETKIRRESGVDRAEGGSDSPANPHARPAFLRTFFWSLAAGLTYVSVVLATVFLFAAAGAAVTAPVSVRVCLLLSGMALGVVAGLSVSFGMGAFFVRKIMGARPIEGSENGLRERVSELFARAQVRAPELWLVDVEQFHGGTAMMAGFAGGRGLFRPGFFISSSTVSALSEEELTSVVLHEISHWSLKHLRKRFVFSTGLVLCASIVTGAAVLCARASEAGEQAQSWVGCMSLVLSFAFSFRLLARQVRYQELAADIHSIEKLGGRLPALASALRKLDRQGLAQIFGKEASAKLLSAGHPATEHRIRILEKYFEKKTLPPAEGSSRDAA